MVDDCRRCPGNLSGDASASGRQDHAQAVDVLPQREHVSFRSGCLAEIHELVGVLGQAHLGQALVLWPDLGGHDAAVDVRLLEIATEREDPVERQGDDAPANQDHRRARKIRGLKSGQHSSRGLDHEAQPMPRSGTGL